MKRAKITIIGSGNVGAAVAHLAVLKQLGNVVLYDIVEGIPQGKGLDLQEAAPIEGFDFLIVGTSNLLDTAHSDIIVITAGMARKPGMSRDDLMETNVGIIHQVIRQVTPFSPNAKLIIVTDPSDVMAQVALQESGFPPEWVMGLGGVLDSTRFCTFIALELGVSFEDVKALVLGGHGDTMVPLTRYSNAGGVPIDALLDKATLDSLVACTRNGEGEIANLLKSSSAYYAPASAIAAMMESILKDKIKIMPISAYVRGEYGLTDLYLGVPVILGKHGIEKIIELDLLPSEYADLVKSAEAVKRIFAKA